MNKRVMAASLAAIIALTMFTGCSKKKAKEEPTSGLMPVIATEKKETEAKQAEVKGTRLKDLNLAQGFYTLNASVKEEDKKDLVQSEISMQVTSKECIVVLHLNGDTYDTLKVNSKRYEKLFDDGDSTFQFPISLFDRENKITLLNSSNKDDDTVISVIFDSKSIKLVEEYSEDNESKGDGNVTLKIEK